METVIKNLKFELSTAMMNAATIVSSPNLEAKDLDTVIRGIENLKGALLLLQNMLINQ